MPGPSGLSSAHDAGKSALALPKVGMGGLEA